MVIYMCTKFHENILGGIKVTERTSFSLEKLQRAIKYADVVSVLVLCTSSDDGFYFVPSYMKISSTVSKL